MNRIVPPSDSPAADPAAGVVAKRPTAAVRRARCRLVPLLAIAALLGGVLMVVGSAGSRTAGATAGASAPAPRAPPVAAPATVREVPRPLNVQPSKPAMVPAAMPMVVDARIAVVPAAVGDPNDIATYLRPGDPAPTMPELIEALRANGVDTGIAAFNPPGTRPLLKGIVVPPEFPLPPGYVRHHQVTDEGQDVPAILMFAPDARLFDTAGRPIALPEDGIVPPELAPPGLPIVTVDLPGA